MTLLPIMTHQPSGLRSNARCPLVLISQGCKLHERMRFALFTKTFRDDLGRFRLLLDSVEKHNREQLPYFVSVPRADVGLFRSAIGSRRVTLLADEDVLGRYTKQSWKSQQLVKLHFWRVDVADAWFWFDADSYFIRSFGLADFVRCDGSVAMPLSRQLHMLDANWDAIVAYVQDPTSIPAIVLGQLGLPESPRIQRVSALSRLRDVISRPSHEARLVRIPLFFGRAGQPLHCLPGAIWTRASLRAFTTEVLEPYRLSFERLLEYAPWEAVWVAEWELARGLPGRHLVEAPLLHIASDDTIRRARSSGLTEARLARRYLGLALAARHQLLERLDGPAEN